MLALYKKYMEMKKVSIIFTKKYGRYFLFLVDI